MGLFGSSSKSSSTTTNLTENIDARVAADGSFVLGAKSNYQVENQFPDSVAALLEKSLDMGQTAVNAIVLAGQQGANLAENIADIQAQRISASLGLNPTAALPTTGGNSWLLIGGILIAGYLFLKGKI